MKRKAILIESSNVNGYNDLPGARVDLANWVNFLKSNLGGAWEDSEIIALSKPSPTKVEMELRVDSDSYCFVAFSGHGSDGSILLDESCAGGFPIASLTPKCLRGTLIVDSCRGVEWAEFFNAQAAANEVLNRSVAYDALKGRATMFASSAEISEHLLLKSSGKIVTHRQIWEEALKKCPNGVVEMLACAKGQAAEEDASAGGYYTSLLLQSADLWKQTTTATVHTTKDAHDYAAANLPQQQTPAYRPSPLAFPFAVDDVNYDKGDSKSSFVITGEQPTQAVRKAGGGRFG
jgi:hypothetical protein